MQVSTAEQWASKKEIKSLTLPSGAVVKVKSSRLYPLLTANLLPLATLEAVSKGEKDPEPGNINETIIAMKKLVDLVVHIVVEPKLTAEESPPAGMLSVVDIPDEDLKFLMSYVLRAKETEELIPFPEGSPGASN